MPNKAAKIRKQQDLKKIKNLQQNGRTRKQYKKKLKHKKNKDLTFISKYIKLLLKSKRLQCQRRKRSV